MWRISLVEYFEVIIVNEDFVRLDDESQSIDLRGGAHLQIDLVGRARVSDQNELLVLNFCILRISINLSCEGGFLQELDVAILTDQHEGYGVVLLAQNHNQVTSHFDS